MFLSRIRVDLNGLSRALLFDIMSAEAYAAHQLLWRLFPEHEGDRPFLFRQEIEESTTGEKTNGLPLFYMLSHAAPRPIEGLLQVESKTFDPTLESGDRLSFRLRANPTVSRRAAAGQRSHRADVLMDAKKPFALSERASQECKDAMDAAARQWLIDRAEGLGFSLPVLPEVGAYRQHDLKKGTGKKPIRYSSLDYEGLLQVEDSARFVESLAQGIGRAKAFGCGLMLIRRTD